MAFSFSQPRRLLPEESSPFNNLLSNALKSYQQQVHARYAPQMAEADIFNKKIGPLATLATSPMFLQNPQFQEALGRLISQNLGSGFGQGGGQAVQGAENHFPTYTEQNKKMFADTKKVAHELSQPGQTGVELSGISGWLQKNLGDTGKSISDFFTGGKINPDLYNKSQGFQTRLKVLKQNAIQTGKISAHDAEREFVQKKNETPDAAMERIQNSFPSLFDNDAFDQSNMSGGESTSDREVPININEEAHRIGVPAKDIMEDAIYFKTTPEMIIKALDAGCRTDDEVKDYIKEHKNGQ
jgi:hypothetical protein